MPVHISVTYPIPSMADNFLISKLSDFKVSIENAIAIEIESGRPSGTATIITATEIVKKSRILTKVSLERSEDYELNKSLITKKIHMLAKTRKPTAYPHLLS